MMQQGQHPPFFQGALCDDVMCDDVMCDDVMCDVMM